MGTIGPDAVFVNSSGGSVSTLGAGAGDDTYVFLPGPLGLTPGDELLLSDTGANNLRLVDGLTIESAEVASGTLALVIGTGGTPARVTILESDAYSFQVGGGTADAPEQTLDFAAFVADILGGAVPGPGEGVVSIDGPIIIGEDAVLETRDLDALGGSQLTPASTDVSSSAVELLDDVNQSNFVEVSGFGQDDVIRYTGTIGGGTVGAEDISVDPGDDTLLTVNNDGVVSQITLLGVSTGLGVQTVADFNALDTGDILFG